eukprot:13694330-Alexandrium_andersonii.AAC.1
MLAAGLWQVGAFLAVGNIAIRDATRRPTPACAVRRGVCVAWWWLRALLLPAPAVRDRLVVAACSSALACRAC